MNTEEREFVLKHLHESRERFLRALDGLTPEQQTFRVAEDQWSIADCAEHLGIVEPAIYQGIQRALAGPPAPEKQAEVQGKTEFLLRVVADRSRRVKGPDRVMPRRAWKDLAELAGIFDAARKQTIAFASQTEADLHGSVFPHPLFNDLDCYQWLLFAALHAERHVRQMEEVMASPGYPGAMSRKAST